MGTLKINPEKYIRMNQIIFSITNSYEARLAKEKKLRKDSLSVSEMGIIMVIGQLQPLNSRTLSQKMEINPGTISLYTERLVKKGLLSRSRDEKDRRNWLLSLTREGEIAFSDTCEGSLEYTSSLMEALSEDEQEILHDLLNRISQSNGYGW
ncbi:MAG: MarR family transcriptional regulator [Spirochaetales bacterium]|nr:MarR family transcriptional regulator [Spirochaetales bacterium]